MKQHLNYYTTEKAERKFGHARFKKMVDKYAEGQFSKKVGKVQEWLIHEENERIVGAQYHH